MKRLIFPVLAAGLAGAMLPLSGSPAEAAPADDFGYSSPTAATPVRIEIYEPTIPIPATPQAEATLRQILERQRVNAAATATQAPRLVAALA